MRTMLKSILFAAATAVAATSTAQAVTVSNAPSNLVGADRVIEFDEFTVASGVEVSNEFTSLGAEFTGLLQAASGFSPRANTSGALLFRFGAIAATISFNDAVTDATFALSSNAGSATFTSFLNGLVVESFTASIANTALPLSNSARVDNVFGFTGSLFDQISIATGGSSGASLDNLSFNIAPVPLPASLPLLLAGAGGLWLLRRRKTAA